MSYDYEGNWVADDSDAGIINANDEELAAQKTAWDTSSSDPSTDSWDMDTPAKAADAGKGAWDKIAESLTKAGGSLSDSFIKALSTPAGIAGLLQTINAARGIFNPSSALAPQKGGYDIPVNMALKAIQAKPNMPEYHPYSGKAVMGHDFGINNPTYAAQGGLMGFAHGGSPRYLDGPTDGMADKINTSIDDKHPAKLSHGEFVIPADVVSHLGNGNSTAGAKVLYKMMERVRKARTGNPKQGKEINPEKFTPGGIAGYAGGGAVAFAAGGTTSGATLTDTSNLSPWVGGYVTDMLSKGQALANQPTPVYGGPLTAGVSPVQQNAFTSAAGLPGAMGPVGSVQSYVNPYMQGAVDVQNQEARRQADITRMNNAGRLTQAGAFGGSRQAIMEAEGDRNLAQLQNNNQLIGLNTAWNNAVNQQKNVADYTANATNIAANIGGQQRGIEQQGIEALKGQFDQQAADPYKRLQFQQSLLRDLPISTSTGTTNYSNVDNLSNLINQILAGAGTK